MGLPEVQKLSAAQAQQTQVVDEKVKAERKAAEEKKANQELSQALAKNPNKANNAEDVKAQLLAINNAKKAGKLDNGDKLMIGAVALGALATVASFVKPSLGKFLKGGAKLLKPAKAASAVAQGGLKTKHAIGAVGLLAGTAVGTSVLQSCDKGILEEEHNHFVPIPTDTIEKEKYIEKIVERPVYVTKYDTIYKTDTVPGEPIIVEKTDTIYVNDTIRVPEYITKTDTIYKTDTVKVPEYINKTDTIYKTDTIKVPEYITVNDTIYETKTDTIFETKTDTIQLPGEIVYVNEEFKSEVPDKMKEMFHDLGIDTAGVGKFVYGLDYQDMKNSKVHRQMWDGGRTSRDGNVYVMNDVATGWDHENEKYTFGKNETFERHDFYVNSNKQLGDDINVPLRPIEVSNNRNEPNWSVFASGSSTAEPGNWQRSETRTFKQIAPGKWESRDGFIYEKGHKPNSIKKTNQYGSEWLLENVAIYGSNVAKDPHEK